MSASRMRELVSSKWLSNVHGLFQELSQTDLSCESHPFHGDIHVRESWRIPSSRISAREVNWLFNLIKIMTKYGCSL